MNSLNIDRKSKTNNFNNNPNMDENLEENQPKKEEYQKRRFFHEDVLNVTIVDGKTGRIRQGEHREKIKPVVDGFTHNAKIGNNIKGNEKKYSRSAIKRGTVKRNIQRNTHNSGKNVHEIKRNFAKSLPFNYSRRINNK